MKFTLTKGFQTINMAEQSQNRILGNVNDLSVLHSFLDLQKCSTRYMSASEHFTERTKNTTLNYLTNISPYFPQTVALLVKQRNLPKVPSRNSITRWNPSLASNKYPCNYLSIHVFMKNYDEQCNLEIGFLCKFISGQ